MIMPSVTLYSRRSINPSICYYHLSLLHTILLCVCRVIALPLTKYESSTLFDCSNYSFEHFGINPTHLHFD